MQRLRFGQSVMGVQLGTNTGISFKWTDYQNNYHPDIIHKYLPSSTIPYRCKPYDENVNSLSVFSEIERKFLQRYLWLRQWPEFFKPKELFGVMKDQQEQEKSEKLLQSFETENDRVHCPDASALQALIPYVKRFLQLFPEIKESTKTVVSSYAAGNRNFQNITKTYVERINQSQLELNCDDSTFRKFVQGEQHQVLQLNIVNSDEWTGLIKVYRVLQKTGCLREGRYTVMELGSLITLDHIVLTIRTFTQSRTRHIEFTSKIKEILTVLPLPCLPS
jgi:hypothetical protein